MLPPSQLQFNALSFGGINPLALYAFLPSFEDPTTGGTIDPRNLVDSTASNNQSNGNWSQNLTIQTNPLNFLSMSIESCQSQLIRSPESGLGSSQSSLVEFDRSEGETGIYDSESSYLVDEDLLDFSKSWNEGTRVD
jgi:hypothetical protein